MFESIVDAVSGSDWSYLIVFVVAMLDAFFPIVPSEATAIAAGVVAGAGGLSVELCILAAALGAIVGDNISFALGHFLGDRVERRFFSSEKSQKRLHWAQRTLESAAATLIVVARFIPGGRTVDDLHRRLRRDLPWRRFLIFDVIAGAIWGSYTRPARLLRRQDVRGGALEGAPPRVRDRARRYGSGRGGAAPAARRRAQPPEPEVAHAAVRDHGRRHQHEEGEEAVQAVHPAAGRILVGREQEDLHRPEDEEQEA